MTFIFWNSEYQAKADLRLLHCVLCIITLLCIPEAVCLQQAPLLAVNSLLGFFFIHHGQDSATAVRGRKAQWSFKRQWYHLFGCHIDVMLIPVGIIMSTDRIKERGKGNFRETQEHTLAKLYFYASVYIHHWNSLFQCLHEHLFNWKILKNQIEPGLNGFF